MSHQNHHLHPPRPSKNHHGSGGGGGGGGIDRVLGQSSVSSNPPLSDVESSFLDIVLGESSASSDPSPSEKEFSSFLEIMMDKSFVSSNSSSSDRKLSSSLPMNGNWRNDQDTIDRSKMTQNIKQILIEREHNSSKQLLDKLPQMVQKLEVGLYKLAHSLEAYKDESTLERRLHFLTMELVIHPHQNHSSSSQSKIIPNHGFWRGDRDKRYRREVLQKIFLLAKKRLKKSSKEWLNNLPEVAKEIENYLYKSAPSLKEYTDTSTLEQRLHYIPLLKAQKTENGDHSLGKVKFP